MRDALCCCSFDTEAHFFFHFFLYITNGILSCIIYDKRGDFNSEIISFSFLGGDVPRSSSYSVYISQVIRFAGVHCIF